MRILKDTLKLSVESDDDPGDYPSNAGSGPQPSRKYAIMEGEVVIELSAADVIVFRDSVRDESLDFWMNEVVDHRLPREATSVTWELDSEVMVGEVLTVTLFAADVEVHPDYGMDDRDYEPDDFDKDYDYDFLDND